MDIALRTPIRVDADGVLRVGDTRVTLDTVIAAYRRGLSAESIAARFPTLDLADVYGVFSYYLHNRVEVDAYLAQREQEADALQAIIEREFPPKDIRALVGSEG